MLVTDATSPMSARGFTLIEMMAVLSIMAILLAVGAPGMSTLLETTRLRTAAFDLVADLTMARNESLKRGAGITVSPVSGSDWSSGWRVRIDDSAEVLRERGPARGSVEIASTPASVAFDRNGRLAGDAGITRIQIASPQFTDASHVRCVSIDPLGRARSVTGRCG